MCQLVCSTIVDIIGTFVKPIVQGNAAIIQINFKLENCRKLYPKQLPRFAVGFTYGWMP